MDSIVEWLDAVEGQLDSLHQLSSNLGSLENQLGDLKVLITVHSVSYNLLIQFLLLSEECHERRIRKAVGFDRSDSRM
jgi:hypothetical protein